MAYLVMARKWRPQTFDEVIGQEHVTTTLKNAIQSNRIHHAYLFTGTRGVGKTTSARILAKALNCENGPTYEPCGQCQQCKQIATGHHIDVLEIDGASNRGIDEIRDLREQVKYTPSQGRYKIYIIDEVHMLTNEAFNALLKTLEEPPSHVVFIFATTESHKIPATILSRCQKFDFRRISTREIQERLEAIAGAESSEIDPEAIYLVARKADGSLRDGQSLLDQIISFSTGRITAQDVQQILGVVDQEIYFRITDCILAQDVQQGLEIVDTVFGQGYDLHEFTMGLIEHFRNLLLVKTAGPNTMLLQIPEMYIKTYQELVPKFNETDILRLLNIALKMENETRKNVHSRSQIELRLIAMITLDSSVSLNSLIDMIGKGDSLPDLSGLQTTKSAPAPEAKTTPNAPKTESVKQAEPEKPPEELVDQPAPQLDLTDLDKVKNKLVEVLGQKSKFLAVAVECGVFSVVGDSDVQIDYNSGDQFHCQQASNTKNKRFIESALSELVGTPVKINCKLQKPDAAEPLPDTKTNASKSEDLSNGLKLSDDILKEAPGLEHVMSEFDGQIVT